MCSCNQKHALIPELENLLLGEEQYETPRPARPGPPARPAASVRAPRPTALRAAPLAGRALDAAVLGNQQTSASIHWGCIVGGKVKAGDDVLNLLGTGASPNERDWANAVRQYQNSKGLPENGVLNDATWKQILKELTPPKFQPLVMPVEFNGKRLGFLEKTTPYTEISLPVGAPEPTAKGAHIEMGLRITDWDAVRKAGFSDTGGRPPFRWIQTVEFVSVPSRGPVSFVRKSTTVIDPTALVESILDEHPYYWDDVLPAGGDPSLLVDSYINIAASNYLCYDLVFEDTPHFPVSVAKPGQRAWFNFETALVGIKQGDPTRNTILNTIRWGYDLVIERGKTVSKLNHLGVGPTGGSSLLKKVISRQIKDFPKHCFVGSGFSAAATCR